MAINNNDVNTSINTTPLLSRNIALTDLNSTWVGKTSEEHKRSSKTKRTNYYRNCIAMCSAKEDTTIRLSAFEGLKEYMLKRGEDLEQPDLP